MCDDIHVRSRSPGGRDRRILEACWPATLTTQQALSSETYPVSKECDEEHWKRTSHINLWLPHGHARVHITTNTHMHTDTAPHDTYTHKREMRRNMATGSSLSVFTVQKQWLLHFSPWKIFKFVYLFLPLEYWEIHADSQVFTKDNFAPIPSTSPESWDYSQKCVIVIYDKCYISRKAVVNPLNPHNTVLPPSSS